MKIIPTARFWSAHTHSRYSAEDALPKVEQIVAKAAKMGQKAIGLTDHGNMAGSVELYKAASKAGIAPFPGSELYFVPDTTAHRHDRARKDGEKAQRYHLGVLAYTTEGYENLVALSTATHKNHFHKPLVDFKMLAQFAEDGRTKGLAITTGCYFGYAAQLMVTRGPDEVKQFLATLESWFPGSVYVEGQNHHIDHGDGWNDDLLADAMLGVAQEMGLPFIITQDSHYLEPTDKELHETLKQLVAFGPDPDDAVFPGDGFHLADDRWMRDHHGEGRLERGLEGLADLLGKHRLSIPVLDSYSYSVPSVVSDPRTIMERRCLAELERRGLKGRYLEKLAEEFEVINAVDMAGYMVLVAQVTDWMRENGVVFQTRGSAAGSMVCWLMGITQVDPIKWDLRFERFLSKDRTKPPDIDLDIAHDRRDELIEWLDTKFTAHQIGSWMKYSLDDSEDEEDEGGSLMRKYFSTATKAGHTYEKLSDIPAHDRELLNKLSDVETYKGMGTNAAGVVLTSTPREFDKLVPLAYMSRGGYVSQYHLKSIEDLGLVKLDVLGSKTLTVLRRCTDIMDWPVAKLDEIPLRDAKVYKTIASGETAGIFQLEGNSSKWGTKSLRPDRIADVIAAMALFRPGVQAVQGDKHYIARKHGREQVPTRHELIDRVTRDTHGIMLYQEQVIDILRGLGMGADDLTAFLKAVKASNSNVAEAGRVIASYKGWIDQRCGEIGMTDEDRQFLDDAFAGFAEYGFNRAHATVYGLTAYRCAWLATHHPVEFHAALLAVAAGDKSKEPKYLRATRSRGVRVLPPSLNISGATYTADQERGVIRKGLRSLDGIGEVTAGVIASLAPFRDLDDLVERAPSRPVSGGKNYDGTPESLNGVLGKLRDQGMLDLLIVRKERRDDSRLVERSEGVGSERVRRHLKVVRGDGAA